MTTLHYTNSMQFTPNELYHVYNRGNNSQTIFFTSENYLFFLRKIRQELLPHVDILAYCLMPTHFHLLIHVKPSSPSHQVTPSHLMTNNSNVNNAIAVLLRSYTRAINLQEGRTGSLFQQKTKAKLLSHLMTESHQMTPYPNNYPLACFHYIHQNPLQAQLVTDLTQWPFSSYLDYAALRNGTLCNKLLTQQLLDLDLPLV